MSIDLDAIESEWLNQCGPCDGGLPMGCAYATGDPRVPLSALVAEVRRLRGQVENLDKWLTAANAVIRGRAIDEIANDLSEEPR